MMMRRISREIHIAFYYTVYIMAHSASHRESRCGRNNIDNVDIQLLRRDTQVKYTPRNITVVVLFTHAPQYFTVVAALHPLSPPPILISEAKLLVFDYLPARARVADSGSERATRCHRYNCAALFHRYARRFTRLLQRLAINRRGRDFTGPTSGIATELPGSNCLALPSARATDRPTDWLRRQGGR